MAKIFSNLRSWRNNNQTEEHEFQEIFLFLDTYATWMLEQMHPFWPRVSDFVVLGSNDRKNRVQKFCEFKDLNDFIGFQTYGFEF